MTLADLVLVDHLQVVIVDVRLIDEHHVLRRAVVTLQHLDMVLLDQDGFLDYPVIGPGNLLREEALPLVISERDRVQSFYLLAQVGDQLRLT